VQGNARFDRGHAMADFDALQVHSLFPSSRPRSAKLNAQHHGLSIATDPKLPNYLHSNARRAFDKLGLFHHPNGR
jgi:hypothetical protein